MRRMWRNGWGQVSGEWDEWQKTAMSGNGHAEEKEEVHILY